MISVICPIYNEEKYIGKCIDSILRQDYPKEDMEVLLVDGMSIDRTREIALSYSKEYPFIHLYDNPNKIVPYAMNIGIQAAKGDIVIRLDAHCCIEQPVRYGKLIFPNRCEGNHAGGYCSVRMLSKGSIR